MPNVGCPVTHRKPNQKTKLKPISLYPDDIDNLDKLAKYYGFSHSGTIRWLIEKEFAQYQTKLRKNKRRAGGSDENINS